MSAAPSPSSPVYVIVGATGGIGQVLCRTLHAAGGTDMQSQGPRLYITARRPEPLAELAEQCGGCPSQTADVRNSEEAEAVMSAALAHYGRIDGVVNLVGSIYLKPPHLTPDADFFGHLAINLHSAFFVLRAAAKAMKSSGGSIVLMSTIAARFGLPNHEVIAAAKGGIEGLVMSAAATYAPHNIRVNAVAPGLIDTPLTRALTQNPAMAKASAALHPLGRFGQPHDIADTIAFLLDPAHSFITGQSWGVDGGMSRARPQVAAATRHA